MTNFEQLNKSAQDFIEKKEYTQAELSLMRALQLKSDDAEVWHNLAGVRMCQKRFKAAADFFGRQLELDPYDIQAALDMIYAKEWHFIWEDFQQDVRSVKEKMAELDAFSTRSMFMDLPHTFEELYTWLLKRHAGDAKLQDIYAQNFTFDHSNHKIGQKIKVGYFTTDLGPSPCGNVMTALFENHNHAQFEIHCFATTDLAKASQKDYGKRLVERQMKCFDFYHDMSKINNEKEMAQAIYDAGIDILIDVNGVGNKMYRTLAYRPAPVQVDYFGVPSTTGLPYYDYVIGDKFTMPESQRKYFSEKIKDMPLCYHPADDKPEFGPVFSKEDCFLPEDKVIYCSFVSAFKITEKYFDMWCRILKAVPDSVLWLLSREDVDEDNLRHEAIKRGITPERIIFLPCMDRPFFLSALRNADLFLDVEIWQAHSTCLESLSACVPLLTCTGNSWASRVPSTMLRTFGLPELVCASEAEYEQKAIAYGLDKEKLAALKEKTKALMSPENPLFNMKQYAKWFEDNLMQMLHEKLR